MKYGAIFTFVLIVVFASCNDDDKIDDNDNNIDVNYDNNDNKNDNNPKP
jgi:uncharacterized membrane protein